MKYIFYYNQKYDLYDKYTYREKIPTRNLPLEYLFDYLYGREQDERLEISKNDMIPNKVILWSKKNIKEALEHKDFNLDQDATRLQDYLTYCKQFGKYGRKRLKEMPAIRISCENYEQLKEQFENLNQRKPQYLIMREHEDGHVDMLEQNELSPEDIKNMDREHKIYQNYKKRLEAYQKAHPNRSYIWRSPEDNEFESDFALYDPVDEQGVE